MLLWLIIVVVIVAPVVAVVVLDAGLYPLSRLCPIDVGLVCIRACGWRPAGRGLDRSGTSLVSRPRCEGSKHNSYSRGRERTARPDDVVVGSAVHGDFEKDVVRAEVPLGGLGNSAVVCCEDCEQAGASAMSWSKVGLWQQKEAAQAGDKWPTNMGWGLKCSRRAGRQRSAVQVQAWVEWAGMTTCLPFCCTLPASHLKPGDPASCLPACRLLEPVRAVASASQGVPSLFNTRPLAWLGHNVVPWLYEQVHIWCLMSQRRYTRS